MQTRRWVAVLGMLAAAAAPPAWAQRSAGSAGKPPAADYDASWPVVLKPGAPRAPSAPVPVHWSRQDIELAQARCAALLDGLDLVVEPAGPIRERAACGTPAPMRLISIGSDPPVVFSPPAVLTCDMIAGLHRWLQEDVQPLARRHLGTPVVDIRVMSSYACRYRKGRSGTKLSEHARANALDFGELQTAGDARPRVLADWGPARREPPPSRRRASRPEAGGEAARAEAIKRQAEAVATARKAQASKLRHAEAPAHVRLFQGTTFPTGFPGVGGGLDDTGLGWAPPSRLGGPKAGPKAGTKTAAAAPADGRRAFLHAIHKAACGIFATVLGPDANRAHRNHLHLDMAQRKSPDICK